MAFLKNRNILFSAVLGLALLNLTVDSLAWFYFKSNNTFLYNLYVPIDLSLILVILIYTFNKPSLKKICLLILLFGLILSACNYAFIQGSNILNTFTLIPYSMLVAVVCYIALRKRFMTGELSFNFINAFLAANIIYYAMSVVVISAVPYLNGLNLELSRKVFLLNEFSLSVKYVMIIVGLIWTLK